MPSAYSYIFYLNIFTRVALGGGGGGANHQATSSVSDEASKKHGNEREWKAWNGNGKPGMGVGTGTAVHNLTCSAFPSRHSAR